MFYVHYKSKLHSFDNIKLLYLFLRDKSTEIDYCIEALIGSHHNTLYMGDHGGFLYTKDIEWKRNLNCA